MKSPKDYVEEYQINDTLFDRHERPIYLQGFIARIQKDAYNQAIEDAANNVTLLEDGIDTESQRYTIQSDSNYYSEVEIDVNKDSILKLKIK